MEEKKVCPNPNGEEGICYSFDRFGDRCGCIGCPLLDTLPNGVFNEGDPLPGLTKQINIASILKKLENCSGEMEINKDECKLILKVLNGYVDRIDRAVKKVKEGIDNTESAINFYKENQESKDDFASELHLLLVRAVNLDDILKALEDSSAPLLN